MYSDGYGRSLKPEYFSLLEDFRAKHDGRCCSCHIHPPCSWCTDPGNPLNLIEDDDAWENELIAAVREIKEFGQVFDDS